MSLDQIMSGLSEMVSQVSQYDFLILLCKRLLLMTGKANLNAHIREIHCVMLISTLGWC